MQDCKLVKVAIPVGTKLSVDQCPQSQEEREYMACVPYANAIKNIMYAMLGTRPDIAHVVGVLTIYMETLGKENWEVVKRVFRYLCGTTYLVIFYHGNRKEVGFHGFVDSNQAGDIDGRWLTSGYILILFGGAISWMSRKQFVVTLSTTKAKYITATHASKEIVKLEQLYIDIGFGK